MVKTYVPNNKWQQCVTPNSTLHIINGLWRRWGPIGLSPPFSWKLNVSGFPHGPWFLSSSKQLLLRVYCGFLHLAETTFMSWSVVKYRLEPLCLVYKLQERLEYLDDGRTVFKLRSRLCSSLYSVNERIREFFAEYDRHILRTSPPWGTELMEVCESVCNSTFAMNSTLSPIYKLDLVIKK